MDLGGDDASQETTSPVECIEHRNQAVTTRIDESDQQVAIAPDGLDERDAQVEQQRIRRLAQRERQRVLHLGTELEGFLYGPPPAVMSFMHLQLRTHRWRVEQGPENERVDFSPGRCADSESVLRGPGRGHSCAFASHGWPPVGGGR